MSIIDVVHSAIAVLLMASILVQNRASGLSATFGGGGATNVVQRRGAEKLIYRASILLSVLFFGLAIARWYIY